MSSPIHCPSCRDFVTETGWGDEAGDYNCRGCGVSFEVSNDPDVPGMQYEVTEEPW